jgi:hypothetical protein
MANLSYWRCRFSIGIPNLVTDLFHRDLASMNSALAIRPKKLMP